MPNSFGDVDYRSVKTMDEAKEKALVDEESIEEFVELLLSCDCEESREFIESDI